MTKPKTVALAILIALVYAATLPLNASLKASLQINNREPDIIQNVFGGMRSFVSDWAFMKAEEYHHRGLPFMGAVSYHHGQSMLEEETRGVKEEERHAQEEAPRGLYSRIYKSVKVTEDSHLLPSEEKEVLPWFYTEVAFNPHDIRGYVLGGYWLERLGRYEESMRFLKEGEKNNPDSAQILTSIGRLYYRDNNFANAAGYLERARDLWFKGRPPNVITTDYMWTDRLLTLDLLGSIYEKEGNSGKAIDVYGEILNLKYLPEVEKKIIELKNADKAVK